MEKYELLIRTMHAAQTAHEKGLENVAEVLDQWTKRLSRLIDAEIQSNGGKSCLSGPRRLPQRLSTRNT